MTITAASIRFEKARRLRRLRLRIGEEFRVARLDAGLTLTELGTATGVDRSHLARIEAGVAAASVDALVALSVALGADLSMRLFLGAGPRLVDRFQSPMIEAFLKQLHPRWSTRLEVPVTTPTRGVVDMAMLDRSSPAAVATEFQSELRRLEQQIRWTNEKAVALGSRLAEERDHSTVQVCPLLVLRSTVATREIARTFDATLRSAYPARYDDLLAAVRSGASPWPGPGLLWMRVERGSATLLEGPPRGVRVGR